MILLLAAASAAIACASGEPLPPSIRVRAFPQGESRAPLEKVTAGPDLSFGPLAPGTWRLEVLPEGFDRATWYPGTEIPGRAKTFEVGDADVDLGAFTLDCRPAARLRAVPPTEADAEALDLRLAEVEVRARDSSTGPWTPLEGAEVVRGRDSILVRGLPEGRAIEAEFTLRHPHLLDGPEFSRITTGPFAAGELVSLDLGVDGVGGAVVYEGDAPWLDLRPLRPARPSPASGELAAVGDSGIDGPPPPSREVAVEDGGAVVPSVPSGTWRVTACADRACTRVKRLWSEVVVVPGRTARLR